MASIDAMTMADAPICPKWMRSPLYRRKALPAPVGAPRIAKPKNGLPPGFSGIAPPDAAGRRYQYVNGRRVNRTDNDNLPDNDAGKQTPPPEPPSMPSQTSQQPQAQTQPFTAPKMPQQPAQQQPEQSQSQQWSVSPAASSVINNHRANAEQRGKQAIDKVTSSWNGPKDDVAKQELASKLKQSFDQAEITINFKPSTTSIFESGMLKTAYETSKGNKGYLGARKKQEKEVLGAGDDMQHSDRPVYAAVNWDKNLYGAASPYGHASFVLNRDAIKERATLTPRDTWGLRNSDEVATMDNPLAAIATNDKALKTAGYKDHGVDDKIVHGSGAYTEVQIWGGSMPLNKQTVKEIRLPNGGAYEHEAQAAKAFADKHGITLTVFDPKNGKTVAFDQAQFAKKKPSLWNRLLGRKSMSRKHLRRSPIWKALKRKSVSGLRRDSRGREYLWVNGKRVAKPKTVGEPIDGRGLEKIASLAEKAIFESLNQVADLVNAVKVIGGGVVSGVNKGQELYGKFTDYIDSQVKKLPGPVEKVVRGAYKLYCAPYAMAQKATGELAKEHGFSPATVHRISATVAVVDFVAGKAQTLLGVGSSIVPLGSLAYLVFATAVHPVATYRAARKGIERARTKLGVVKGMLPEATMVALGERMEKYGEDYFAAFLVAMDTERDAKKAMRLADEVVRGREQEEKHLDLTAHILAGIVGGMVTKSMRAFVIKATKRREGEQWVTNGRHYRRAGGKTVRIAPPGAKEETPAKPSSKDAKYAAAKDAVDRLKGGDPNAVDEVMESLGKLTVPQLRALAKEQGFAKVSGRAKKEILDGLKAGLVPGNSAVGGGTSVGSRGSSSAAVSEAFVDRFFNYVYKDSLNSDRFKNETPENQAALIAKGKQESRAQLEKMAKRIADKDVSLADTHALHPSNKMYRELFTEVTGITLPSGSEATRKAVKEFLGEKYQEHAKSRADKEANEAKEKADKKRVEKETKDSEYSGFAADLPPRQRAKIHATLETQVSHNGKVTTRKELVERLVKEGFAVDGEKLTNGSNYYDKQAMTKTGLDYASHLVKQGFGPKEGERNSAGLVFHNHRWHREDDIDPVRVNLRQLPSGTMATLTGRDKYDDIEAARKMLDAWLSARPGVKWGSWQDAWGEFVAKYPEYSKDRPEEREEEIGQHVGNGTTKNGRNVSFVPNRYGVMSGGETTIIIDPAKLDQAWKKESHYLPADGRGVSEKMGGRKEFRHFLETGEAVESSRLALGLDGSVDFVDGRHRFAVLRDAGIDKMAVSVPKHQINQFRERFGLDAKADSSKEPWQMTVGDWSKWEAEAFGTSPREPSQRQKEWYLGQVRDAIADGKPVPAEVLADYPDLKLKDDAPKSSRQTPSKGTPERDKQDAEWNDTYAKVEAAAEAASKVKEERDNTKRSTKKYDQLDAKYRKLQDEYESMHRDMQPLRKLNRLALLEDTIEHGDEANAIAAKAMMDREAGNNKRHDDAYTKIMSLAEASLKSNYGLTDSDAIKSIAMDATSMVLGYPGIESTLDVRLKGAVTTYNRKAANRANREAIDALNDLSKEQKASFHRRVENAEFAPDTQAQIIAEAKAENESNRKLNELAAEHEKRAEESRQEREAFDPDIDSIPVKSIRTKGLIKDLNASPRWGFLATAQEFGYATNAKYLFKLPEKELKVIREAVAPEGRKLPKSSIDTLLDSNHEVEPATIKGVRHLENVDLNSPTYLIESPHGTQALMNATYVRLILDRYPNATIHLPPPAHKSKAVRPVVFKDQGNVIGVVMPIEDGRKYKVKG